MVIIILGTCGRFKRDYW